jgi:hypothetical protein
MVSTASLVATRVTAMHSAIVWIYLVRIMAPGIAVEYRKHASSEQFFLPAHWPVSNYRRVTHGFGIPFLMMGFALLVMCVAVYLVLSLRTAAPAPEEPCRMGWRPPLKVLTETKITGPFDPRVMAFGLIILMVVLYILMR